MKVNKANSDDHSNWYSWMYSRMTVFFALSVFAAGTYVANLVAPSERAAKVMPADIKNSIISHTTKTRSPMQAYMAIEGQTPKKAGDEFTLVISLKTEHDASSINARWIIPDGIEILQGSTRPEIVDIARGETKEIRATFRQLTDRNERIHFKLSGNATGMRSSLTLQYNSLEQERIDLENKNLREVAAEQMKKDLAVDAMQKGHSHHHSHLAE